MPRYFLEVAYNGAGYSGFQRQQNANTVQAEVEKAFQTLQRQPVFLTGSSRTDTGVHALQNFFHFDFEGVIHSQFIYKVNAILPEDVVVKNLTLVADSAHCRFDALSREYEYRIYRKKDPFLKNFSFYFPYQVDKTALQAAAEIVKTKTEFVAFCKTNTQVKNYNCVVYNSQWVFEEENMFYTIESNRFLRGMVRLLTAALLRVGRGTLSLSGFEAMFSGERRAAYSVPPHGLFLRRVSFPAAIIVQE